MACSVFCQSWLFMSEQVSPKSCSCSSWRHSTENTSFAEQAQLTPLRMWGKDTWAVQNNRSKVVHCLCGFRETGQKPKTLFFVRTRPSAHYSMFPGRKCFNCNDFLCVESRDQELSGAVFRLIRAQSSAEKQALKVCGDERTDGGCSLSGGREPIGEVRRFGYAVTMAVFVTSKKLWFIFWSVIGYRLSIIDHLRSVICLPRLPRLRSFRFAPLRSAEAALSSHYTHIRPFI